ncbi:sensor histidine kinase [Sandarakinorhabdus oryzae]|uniref:sensor histidine kinase n=1 Tax=Sandarakinorhabdus oryzae TaxID=2675220 RepID=UPI0018CC40EE|nr:HAMP domain-containing sensor histidine kinase [Sandarakinorhabdus oryzae]
MGGLVLLFLVAMAAFTWVRPNDQDTVSYWYKFGKWTQTGFNVGIAASPWVLLPGGDVALQYFTTMMYVWYIGVATLTSNAGVPIGRWEVVLMTVSLAVFALSQDTSYRIPVAILISVIGLTMLGLRSLVQRALGAALEAQAQSARSEAATQRALAIVAAERDSKTRFIASATHDLQQPLAAAGFHFESSLQLGPQQDRAVAGVRSSLASASELIGLMLDYLRLDAGAVKPRPQPVPLGPLMRAEALNLEPAAAAAGMTIRIAPSSAIVVGDPAILARAIGNLLANAVRHSGGRHVLIGTRRRGALVDLWVIDDGRGLPDGWSAWLFADYGTGAVATARMGLGLASVRRQSELLGGSVALEPRWRHGAAFRLSLPRA